MLVIYFSIINAQASLGNALQLSSLFFKAKGAAAAVYAVVDRVGVSLKEFPVLKIRSPPSMPIRQMDSNQPKLRVVLS